MGDRSELGGVLCQYDDRMVSGDSPCKAVGYSDPLSGGAQIVPMGTSQNYSEGGGKLPDHTGAEGVSERAEITDNAFYIQDEDLKPLTQIYVSPVLLTTIMSLSFSTVSFWGRMDRSSRRIR